MLNPGGMMDPAAKIQEIINGIDRNKKNNTGDIHINIVKNEFVTFNGSIVIPKIWVKELAYDISVDIVRNISEYIPEFLFGHMFLAKRKPAAELNTLQFVRRIEGKLIDFIHMFKIDFKFGGDSSNVIEKGDTAFYPSYKTNRVYYKSRLIPVRKQAQGPLPGDFEALKLQDSTYVETDQHLHTFAVFDDLNVKEITTEIFARLDLDVFNLSRRLYSFIEYDYFTSCMNVVKPDIAGIEAAAELFEPLFCIIYSRYRSVDGLGKADDITGCFPEKLVIANGELKAGDAFVEYMKKYFGRFSHERDDDLVLKGWWRFVVSGD
jgi:hypothetical protein